jgi:beta-lactamase regulating signal transducer with metallopeptidase domain
MPVLIGIALKSLLIAGLTLGLLQLMKARSPAERSCIAHIGLFALVVMALAPLVLPNWTVELPALSQPVVGPLPAPSPATDALPPTTIQSASGVGTAAISTVQQPSLDPLTIAISTYALPAAVLLLLTLVALVRLIALRARADVLVDAHWLSALARAQRRMGFKHGTALLTSNDLASPISWGLLRPVILLSNRAVEATDEAEAIIAHELAHVARMDWIKLLLARVATALFWFNPLVWMLAREAHQLREEAADDSVLGANIADTDYAQLLVGVARHECPGLLLGAHGVAPSKSSLARRVARVLDSKLVRRPAARPFSFAAFAVAITVAAPLAALTIAPAAPTSVRPVARGMSALAPSVQKIAQPVVPTDLPSLIAQGVSKSVVSATAAIAPATLATVASARRVEEDFTARSPNGGTVESKDGVVVSRAPSGATVTVYPPDAQGRRKTVARSATGAVAIAYADADADLVRLKDRHHRGDRAIDTAIEMRALGITAEFVAAMRASSPALRNAGLDDVVGMRAVGVTPEYARQIAGAGYPNADADDLQSLRAVGVTPDYVRAIRATGTVPSVDELIELKTMGITADELARVRASGASTKHKLRQLERFASQRTDPSG